MGAVRIIRVAGTVPKTVKCVHSAGLPSRTELCIVRLSGIRRIGLHDGDGPGCGHLGGARRRRRWSAGFPVRTQLGWMGRAYSSPIWGGWVVRRRRPLCRSPRLSRIRTGVWTKRGQRRSAFVPAGRRPARSFGGPSRGALVDVVTFARPCRAGLPALPPTGPSFTGDRRGRRGGSVDRPAFVPDSLLRRTRRRAGPGRRCPRTLQRGRGRAEGRQPRSFGVPTAMRWSNWRLYRAASSGVAHPVAHRAFAFLGTGTVDEAWTTPSGVSSGPKGPRARSLADCRAACGLSWRPRSGVSGEVAHPVAHPAFVFSGIGAPWTKRGHPV